jgi:uncharacterized membrane protein YjjP (DUF1212 family)
MSEARDFVLDLGRGLHSHGYPAHRLEEALTLVARRLGLEGQFFSMPTALFASFGAAGDQRTFQIRVEPGAVDLGRLAAIDGIASQVAGGELTPAAGSVRLAAVIAAPPLYGAPLTTLAFALTSGATARFFGGSVSEIVTATVIGCAIGLIALVASRVRTVERIFEPLAAALAAALASLAGVVAPVSIYIATVAGLIVLIPGFSLTVAMIELATRNLVSGTARLAGALGTFLAIGFGVALGTRLVQALVGRAPRRATLDALPEWTLFAALLLAPLGFTVLLRAQPRDTFWIMLAGPWRSADRAWARCSWGPSSAPLRAPWPWAWRAMPTRGASTVRRWCPSCPGCCSWCRAAWGSSPSRRSWSATRSRVWRPPSG